MVQKKLNANYTSVTHTRGFMYIQQSMATTFTKLPNSTLETDVKKAHFFQGKYFMSQNLAVPLIYKQKLIETFSQSMPNPLKELHFTH